MNNSIISSRYAKALLMVGNDNQCLDTLKADMELLYTITKENADFAQMLNSPIIKPSDKVKVMDSLMAQRIHPMTINFINMLIRNKRETMLLFIAHRFIELYDAYKGIKHAHISSAIELDEKEKMALQERLNAIYQAEIKMTTEVNPDLIGGFIARIGDQQYDASLSSSLERIRKALEV